MSLLQRRLPSGEEITLVDPGETALLYREVFDDRTYLRSGFPSSAPAVIVDVGANIGLACLLFKQRFPEAHIIAVEPAPETYLALRKNFARHVPDGETHNVAVTGENGVAHFGYYPKAPAESGFYTDQDGDSALAAEFLVRNGFSEPDAEQFARDRHRLTTVECRTVTLSTLIGQAGITHIDLLKIDVEKSELDVLAGIEGADWNRIGHLVLEVHDIDDRLAVVVDLLRRKGFRAEPTQDSRLTGTGIHLIFASRDPGAAT